MESRRLFVPDGLAGERVDVGLAKLLGFSRTYVVRRYTAAAVALGALTETENVPSGRGVKRLTSTTLWHDTRRTTRTSLRGVVSGRTTRPLIVTMPPFAVRLETVMRRWSLSGSESSLPISALTLAWIPRSICRPVPTLA